MQATTPQATLRLLIVDDHFMVRLGLQASLDGEPDLEVVATAGQASEALTLCEQLSGGSRSLPCDVAVLDVRLPGTGGIELAGELHRRYPSLRILMLSTHSGEDEVYRALQNGAHGYLLKSAERATLLLALRAVGRGERYIDPSVAGRLVARMNQPELTEREMDVLRRIVRGQSNKEIGNSLGITEGTVKLHVSHLLGKIGAEDRTQAVRMALLRGLVTLE